MNLRGIEFPEYLADFIFHDLAWYLMIAWLIYSLYTLFISKSFTNYYIFESIPSVFVTLGLLGTFLGITYGLLHFNVEADQIKNSISELLTGLKDAFFTSITGIILSLIFSKVVKYQISKGLIKDRVEVEELGLFKEIAASLTEIKELSERRTAVLVNSIGSRMESIEQKIEGLTTRLDDVFTDMAEENAGAIQEALKSVLEDFNNTLKGFIGELVDRNFDKLTESIDSLVMWQKQYKGDIEAIRNAYAELVEKHRNFAKTTEGWVNNLEQIAGKSSALKSIVEEFKAAFNDDSNFSEIIGKIEGSANTLLATSNEVKSLFNNLSSTSKEMSLLTSEVSDWLTKEDGVKEQTEALANALVELRKIEVSQIENFEESFQKRLESTFKALDDIMTEQLKYIVSKNQK